MDIMNQIKRIIIIAIGKREIMNRGLLILDFFIVSI